MRLRVDVQASSGEELTAAQDELLRGSLVQLVDDLVKARGARDDGPAPMEHATTEDARRRVLTYYRRELLPSMIGQIMAVLEPKGDAPPT